MVKVNVKAELIQSMEHPLNLNIHDLPSGIVRASTVDILGWSLHRRLMLENRGGFYFARYTWEEGKVNQLDFYLPRDVKIVERWVREYLGDEILLDMEHKFRLEFSVQPTDRKTLNLSSQSSFKNLVKKVRKLAKDMFEQHILSLEVDLSGCVGFPPKYRFKIYLHNYDRVDLHVEERDALWHYIYDYEIYLPSWKELIPTLKKVSPVLFA